MGCVSRWLLIVPLTSAVLITKQPSEQVQDAETDLLVQPSELLSHSSQFKDRLTQHVVDAATAARFGAACLDGSPPYFAHRPASNTSSRRFVVELGGGGWCDPRAARYVGKHPTKDGNFDPCIDRAKTSLGSSKRREGKNINAQMFPLLSGDHVTNPDFAGDAHVFIGYCDGSSFVSSRNDSLDVHGTRLFFRGRANLMAVFHLLLSQFGLASATELVLSGTSAGGLAVLLNIDFLSHEFLPQYGANIPVVGVSDGGFFLDVANIHTHEMWHERWRKVDEVWEATSAGSLSKACLSAHVSDEAWKCFLPQYAAPFLTSSVFVANSAVDVWQLEANVGITCLPALLGDANSHVRLLGDFGIREDVKDRFGACDNDTAVKAVEEFRAEFNAQIHALDRNRNGYIVDNCFGHGHAQSDWTRDQTFNGNASVSVAEIVQKWWRWLQNVPGDPGKNNGDGTIDEGAAAAGIRVIDSRTWNAETRVHPMCLQ